MLAVERVMDDWRSGAKNKSSVKKKCSTMADAKKSLKFLRKNRWEFFLTSVGVIIKRF